MNWSLLRLLLALSSMVSALVFANNTSITNLVYSEKGLAGKQIMTKVSDTQYHGSLDLRWNNRVFKVDEKIKLNEKGQVLSFESTGLSPFGAAIAESFKWQDGIASWESNKEDGRVKSTGERFYLPVNSAVVAENLMVQAMLKNIGNSIELLPSGTARLTELKTVKLSAESGSEQVTLYAISGLGFTPDFSWYDSQGNFFAKDHSGFMKVIREGFTLDDFDKLKVIQNSAEQEYLEGVSSKLSHSYTTLLIKNAQVVDVINSVVLKNTDVLFKNGKVSHVAKNINVPENTPTIDGSGKTLIPGLWDMHGHLSKGDGLLNIAAGVTNVRDVGNSHDNIMTIERLFNTNQVIGNRVFRAGFFDQMSEFSAGLSVKSLAEAHEKIDWFADNGYIQIKLYSSIDPTWVESIAKHAHSRGLRLSGHIPAFMTAEQAVKAGYDEIQHINMLFLNFLAGTEVDTRQQLRFTLIGEKAGDVDINSKEFNDFIQLLADNQTVIDPTISTFRSLLLKERKKIDPEFLAVAEHLPPNVLRQLKGAEMNVSDDLKDNYQAGADAMSALVKKLYDKGVPIVPGTDNIAGFTLQRELELYADAGIPEMDVLKIASINSARLVGAAHYLGSITEGKSADVLLIDGDPLTDMSVLRKTSLVIKDNHFYKPEELYKILGVKPFTPSSHLQ
ncbi:amidohydrolase family protein [Colwellia psychrerythraea]|uniref:Amidohydrolase family protein n=1 Tax=Colwellia psychrerythraea (strain 34H / ATCC BAA-681) TaxID=167879 RepID=Q489H1_COLP3|nr:amidohydrolase family protein [Colwellia psychrerythraea]AAZ28586.1 amidohydrolase family protein [Colwellia psychrerythraea 34H]